MVNPGIIYHMDTRGNKGLITLKGMAQKGLTLSPYSHVIHYANSVFEGIRAVWDENEEKLYLITLDEHINRFLGSIKSKFHGNFSFDKDSLAFVDHLDDERFGAVRPSLDDLVFLDLTYDEIKDAIMETVETNIKMRNIDPKQGCYVRPIVYRDQTWNKDGEFDPSLGIFSLKHDVVFEIEAFTWPAYLRGTKTIVYPEGIDSPLRHIKSGGNYAFGGMAHDWAITRGYDEVIITDTSPERNVLEGGGENLFVYYTKDTVLTPDKSQSILPGTKRDLVIKISKNLGYKIIEMKIPLEVFLEAESAAFSGTAAGYVGIDRVKDAKTKEKRIFKLDHEPLVKTVKEYHNLISGKEVNEKNKELQKEIRTEVLL